MPDPNTSLEVEDVERLAQDCEHNAQRLIERALRDNPYFVTEEAAELLDQAIVWQNRAKAVRSALIEERGE